MKQRDAIFGTLSLFALCGGFFVGVASTMHIASETEGMASFGAIAGIAIGLMACVPSLILSVLGLFRNEKPLWPAALGLFLSALPGGIGLYMLALLLKHYL